MEWFMCLMRGNNNSDSNVFMDVINIYNENSASKVNGIEKYLADLWIIRKEIRM